MTDNNTETKEKPSLDYVEHLVKQIFAQYVINNVLIKQEGGKLVIQAYEQIPFENAKRIIEQKLEVGKDLVNVILIPANLKGDSWLSLMGDGRDGLEGEDGAE